MAPERTPPGTSSDLDAALRSVSTGIGRLRGQLAAADSFHRVAVQQRDAAWKEIEQLKAEIADLRTKLDLDTNDDARRRAHHDHHQTTGIDRPPR